MSEWAPWGPYGSAAVVAAISARGDQWKDAALKAEASVAELRARAEKAEAEAAREFESGNDWCVRALAAEAEAERLRGGIQALADEWDGLAGRQNDWNDDRRDRADAMGHAADALRGLLSPTPEGPTT